MKGILGGLELEGRWDFFTVVLLSEGGKMKVFSILRLWGLGEFVCFNGVKFFLCGFFFCCCGWFFRGYILVFVE